MLDAQGVSYKSFWVANEIVVHSGGRALVDSLAARSDVKVIEANDSSNWLSVDRCLRDGLRLRGDLAGERFESAGHHRAERDPVQGSRPLGLGFTGTGIVVGNQDTGMRWTHNALKPHYRGWNGSSADHNYNWHDSIHALTAAASEPVRIHRDGSVRRPRPRDAHDRYRRR